MSKFQTTCCLVQNTAWLLYVTYSSGTFSYSVTWKLYFTRWDWAFWFKRKCTICFLYQGFSLEKIETIGAPFISIERENQNFYAASLLLYVTSTSNPEGRKQGYVAPWYVLCMWFSNIVNTFLNTGDLLGLHRKKRSKIQVWSAS